MNRYLSQELEKRCPLKFCYWSWSYQPSTYGTMF